MANWNILKTAIANAIRTNGNNEITGQSLQDVLKTIVSSVGENATFAGVAGLETNPGAPDGPIFYIASEPGTYSNFSGISVSKNEVAILKWTNEEWKKLQTGIGLSKYTINYNFIAPGASKDPENRIKEIFISGLENDSDIVCTLLIISSTEFEFNFKFSDGSIIHLKEIGNIVPDKVYITSNNKKICYIVLGDTSDFSYSSTETKGIFSIFGNKVKNISYSPTIAKYLFSSSVALLSNNHIINSHIANLFIRTDSSNTISVILYRWHNDGNNMHLYLYKNGIAFARLLIDDTASIIPYNVYKLDVYDNSDDTAYIVFNNIDATNIEIQNIELNSDFIYNYSKNPIIERHFINNTISINEKKLKWTSDNNFNAHIEELYIPGLTDKYGEDCRISRLYTTANTVNLFIRTHDNSRVVVMYKDVTDFYYVSGSITPLYDANTNALIGWFKPSYSGDSELEGFVSINAELVENIDNSPSIKHMLSANEQLIIMGDSILGQPAHNFMPDALRGITGIKVWNIACGGCAMALRNSGYYDSFSFTTFVDSLISGDYSVQEDAITNRGSDPDFTIQVENAKLVDLSKPTVILCNYVNNDLTTNVPIGELWKYTDAIDDYDKNTFCGAQNYGVQKLLTNFPHLKIVFITDSYRLRKQGGSGELVPPYLYQNGNGDTAENYTNSEINNCERLGIKVYDFRKYGVRNAFTMSYSTVDGTHCNAYGFQELAKYLNNIYSEIK